jgi:hypothetical protein
MIAAVLRELMAAGLEGQALIAAVERIKAAMAPAEVGKAAAKASVTASAWEVLDPCALLARLVHLDAGAQ